MKLAPRQVAARLLAKLRTVRRASSNALRQQTFEPKYPQTLYLHLGTHRTGTTSTQRFLRSNSSALQKQGILIPTKRGRHERLFGDILKRGRPASDVAEWLFERAEAAPHEIGSIVLSDEDASMSTNLVLLQEFRHFFDVKIIYTLRRQDTWLESWYFQNIKWQWNPKLSHCTWPEFLAQRAGFHWVNYDAHLGRLEQLFGQENVLISVFEKQQMLGGPIAAFMRLLGVDDLSAFDDPPHVNSSMSIEMVEFMRHLPLGDLPQNERAALRNILEQMDVEILGKSAKQSERLMDNAARKAILAEYEEGNRAVAQRYLGRDALFLDALPQDEPDLAQLALPANSAELMEKFVGPMLINLAKDGKLNRPQ